MKQNREDRITLLIDGAAGIYVPRNFYERFDLAEWNLNVNSFSDLSRPENDDYWEAWDAVLRDAKHTDKDGRTWTLYQDGDLFAVRDDYNEDAEENAS